MKSKYTVMISFSSPFSLRLQFSAIVVTIFASLGLILGSPQTRADSCGPKLRAGGTSQTGRVDVYKAKVKLLPDLAAWARATYGPRAEVALKSLTKLGATYTQLVVDPGIVLHLEDFVKFAESHAVQDAWETREKFSASLGKRTIYRALTITSAQESSLRENGVKARLLRELSLKHELFWANEYGELTTTPTTNSLETIFRARIDANANYTSLDTLMSVTTKPDIGTTVAMNYLGEGRKIYLATLSVPVLDLIYPSEKLGTSKTHSPLSHFVEVFPANKTTPEIVPEGPDMESFVMYNIDASEIDSLVPVEDKDIGYIVFKESRSRKPFHCLGKCPPAVLTQIAQTLRVGFGE